MFPLNHISNPDVYHWIYKFGEQTCGYGSKQLFSNYYCCFLSPINLMVNCLSHSHGWHFPGWCAFTTLHQRLQLWLYNFHTQLLWVAAANIASLLDSLPKGRVGQEKKWCSNNCFSHGGIPNADFPSSKSPCWDIAISGQTHMGKCFIQVLLIIEPNMFANMPKDACMGLNGIACTVTVYPW